MHTLVLGATTNPARTAYTAIERLVTAGHKVTAVGIRVGQVAGVALQQGQPDLSAVHTITLYLNPQRQREYYDYILGLQPQRIIFNPGTENVELLQLAKEKGIATEIACTLVMLATGEYDQVSA